MGQPQYEPGVEVPPRNDERRPSRGLAFALSLLSPGLGHLYLGSIRRGFFWAYVPMALTLSFLVAVVMLPLRALFGSCLLALMLFVVGGWCGALIDLVSLPKARFHRSSWWVLPLFWAGNVALGTLLALFVRTCLVQAFKIPSGAMRPSLMVQDHIFVNMRAFREPPRRGQMAVYRSPVRANQDFVHRVIAVPGDVLSVSGGHPAINGWQVPHCYVGRTRWSDAESGEHAGDVELEFLGDERYLIYLGDDSAASATEGPWTVPPGEVFVLGDNRFNSFDSRAWHEGAGAGVPFQNLLGKPVFVWLAFREDGSINGQRCGLPLDELAITGWPPQMQAGLRACLAKQPSRAEREPPRAAK